jgi:Arc/MetJ family transcription regulator
MLFIALTYFMISEIMWIHIAIPIHINETIMRTVQMTLDDDLISEVDRMVKRLDTNRSAFTRDALRNALSNYRTDQLENQHRRGYQQRPVSGDEFKDWEDEQVWDTE